MKHTRQVLAAASLLLASPFVLAQASPPPASAPTREEVSKQAREATKAGKIEHGEADHDAGRPSAKVAKSGTSSAQVRKEGAAAAKAGQTESGEASVVQKAEEGVKPKK